MASLQHLGVPATSKAPSPVSAASWQTLHQKSCLQVALEQNSQATCLFALGAGGLLGLWSTRKRKPGLCRKQNGFSTSNKVSLCARLETFVIDIPEFGGAKIAITPCPGNTLRGRNLKENLDQLGSWGAQAIVTLIEDREIKSLGVENIQPEVERRGMKWFHCPIGDFGSPGKRFEEIWVKRTAGKQVREILRTGGKVVVHCRGGIGRAGTIAARLLVELGVAGPSQAVVRVRRARPGAVETWEQEEHVMNCKPLADGS
eukprot:TRINITY_DN45973_c0_g1_i1.p1 TRINITY_DN45973_c0_g1~~TRINITY_DN45973_c0_g1_i1.p1  ORF type:complete len:259 (-),score=32.08 TRINITY_DN45973_c0_g1_i1:119-895(-)